MADVQAFAPGPMAYTSSSWNAAEPGGFAGPAATTNTPMNYSSGAMNTWSPGQSSTTYNYSGAGGDTNQSGANSDPFGYTDGSLLTPWTGRFSSSGYGGGYSAPAYTPFHYADFGYQAPSAGRFTEQYQDPAAFRFADFNGPSAFKAPTAEDMKADPGYQARMDAVQKAQTASAAHGGTINTGGFQKGLAQAVGNQASQEYGNTYNRALQNWNTNWGQAKDTYGLNQGNTKQAFDTNTANRLAGHNTRQNDWAGNANVALQEGQLGYNIAQGTWDRNEQLARQGWQDNANNAQAQASAASANANQSYQRDLDDYTRSRDEFWTNQDRQNALLNQQAGVGLQAANAYGNQLMNGYGAQGNMAIGAGDARASGQMGSANAWGGFAGNLGSTIGQLGMYAQYGAPSSGQSSQGYNPYMGAGLFGR